MFFASERAGGVAVWIARRVNQTQEWGTPERLGAQINVAGSMTLAPFISSDQRSLYFMSARPDTAVGGACTPKTCFDRVDLYRASVTCR